VRVVALDASTTAAWVGLFEASRSPCYCRYWHFEGNKNAWLDRCAFRPEENRDEQVALVRAGVPEARGLLAMEGEVAVGWMKLAPRALVPKLRRQGAYRPLDLGPDEGIWSIGCFLVHPGHRREGVARALVGAAPAEAKLWGGTAVEAYPRGKGAGPLHDEQAWVGTEELFESCGFRRIAGEAAYPVMRRDV
jgi:GNAT superfamily N-acetyltransferase